MHHQLTEKQLKMNMIFSVIIFDSFFGVITFLWSIYQVQFA